MSFMDKVKSAAQGAKDKTNEIIEVSKVNRQIGQNEDKIDETYALMGKQVFSEFMNGTMINPDLKRMCEEIVSAQTNVEELKTQIFAIKNIKLCSKCKSEMPLDIAFCPKCGTKQE